MSAAMRRQSPHGASPPAQGDTVMLPPPPLTAPTRVPAQRLPPTPTASGKGLSGGGGECGEFAVGRRVVYKNAGGDTLLAEVAVVDFSVVPPAYTIRLPDGRERATEAERLHAVPEPACAAVPGCVPKARAASLVLLGVLLLSCAFFTVWDNVEERVAWTTGAIYAPCSLAFAAGACAWWHRRGRALVGFAALLAAVDAAVAAYGAVLLARGDTLWGPVCLAFLLITVPLTASAAVAGREYQRVSQIEEWRSGAQTISS